MSLTRKMLKGMSLTEEQVESIIENHNETVNGLKDEINTLKEEKTALENDKQKLEKDVKALEKFKAEHSEDTENELQSKYDQLDKEYKDYKAGVEQKELERKNKAEYRKILKEAGIIESKIDAVIKVSADEIGKMKYDKDNKLENKDDLLKSAKEEWKEFIQNTSVKGADVDNPNNDSSSGSTRTESDAVKSIKQQRASMYGELKND